jgi:hypothetical protein
LTSLLLIASAIAVNTARYPVVWDMVGSLEAGTRGHRGPDSAAVIARPTLEPTAADGGQLPAEHQPAQPDQRVIPAETAPLGPKELYEPPAGEKSPAAPGASPPLRDLAGPRPLVPVVWGEAEPSRGLSAADGQVHRLPPVTRVGPRPLLAVPAAGDAGPPVTYPSTGF